MLTGRPLFQGETISHVLAGVLKDEPDWSGFPTDVPPPLLDLLRRCLRKDAKQRLQAIGDARVILEEYLADPQAAVAQATIAAAQAPSRSSVLPWAVAGVLAVALAGALVILWSGTTGPSSPLSRHVSIELPDERLLFRGYGSSLATSPDGTQIAYTFGKGDLHSLYVHALDQWEGRLLLEGTSGDRPYQPFFSPDGAWIGFVTPGHLKKVPVSGGTPITLCDVNFARGASWSEDGTIVFAPGPASGLVRIQAAGGEPTPLTELDLKGGEATHRWPQVLPGGKAVLFTSHGSTSDFFRASIELLVFETGERKVLHRGGTYGRYLRSGHLVYVNAGTLLAMPFDLGKLEPSGFAAPVVEGVSSGAAQGSAQFDVSPDGTFVYAAGAGSEPEFSMVWRDREGKTTSLWDEKHSFKNPSVSPDGTRLAVEIENEGQADIWVYDIERDVPTRLTFDDASDGTPAWAANGEQIVFASQRDGAPNLYRMPADGSGEAVALIEPGSPRFGPSLSADGRMLAFIQIGSTGPDVWLLQEGGEPTPLVESPAAEVAAAVSPDGNWVAYLSNESGSYELYVRPTSGKGRWQISANGGGSPEWSSDGSELFFNGDDDRLHVARIDTEGGKFRAGREELLFDQEIGIAFQARSYDVAPDGKRFVVLEGEDSSSVEGHEHIRVVLDWFDELNRTFGGRP